MNPTTKRLVLCLMVCLVAAPHLIASVDPNEALPGLPVHDVFGYLVFDPDQADGITPTLTCEQQFCADDGDCRWLCGCEQAVCSGWVCSNPCAGGGPGGGGGGGGVTCNAFCTDDTDCAHACPGGTNWSCSGYRCVS